MASGIYQIKNTLNGNRYIGSAADLRRRWQQHLSALRHSQHHNRHLQRAFDKYGEEAFIFEVLEEDIEPENLIEREQHYFDTLEPAYNTSPTAGSQLGMRRTDETRAKISAANTGKRHPFYGKHHSAETLAKMSAALTGKRHPNYGKHPSEKTLAKMRAANSGERHSMYGKHHSAETIAKIRAANTGERHPFYGKHHSAETLAKMRAANIGKHHSEETKRKMRIAQRARRRRERELKEK